ncbi:unnamed protein product [Tetraodon nigroviridis]|uniref:(spotted green pufferfish) hypothetical protein n=1 Tax=Tetraodon nigroviridis TaxID=99883 RepID=Q4T0B1_TETNG|nr:unnamed protein product [Tetraodon nigroviridis]
MDDKNKIKQEEQKRVITQKRVTEQETKAAEGWSLLLSLRHVSQSPERIA